MKWFHLHLADWTNEFNYGHLWKYRQILSNYNNEENVSLPVVIDSLEIIGEEWRVLNHPTLQKVDGPNLMWISCRWS